MRTLCSSIGPTTKRGAKNERCVDHRCGTILEISFSAPIWKQKSKIPRVSWLWQLSKGFGACYVHVFVNWSEGSEGASFLSYLSPVTSFRRIQSLLALGGLNPTESQSEVRQVYDPRWRRLYASTQAYGTVVSLPFNIYVDSKNRKL